MSLILHQFLGACFNFWEKNDFNGGFRLLSIIVCHFIFYEIVVKIYIYVGEQFGGPILVAQVLVQKVLHNEFL